MFIALFVFLGGCIYFSNLPAAVPEETVVSSSKVNQKPELFLFLEYIHGPLEVVDMARKGRERYQREPLKSQLTSLPWDGLGGGRQRDWIQQTFGLPEELIVKQFSELPPPYTWAAHEIEKEYENAVARWVVGASEKPAFYVVQNVGINGLHRTDLGRGAMVQLASQFNYLESPSSGPVPVSQYLYDNTQGPQGAIEAAADTMYRHAIVSAGKLPHALHNVLPQGNSNVYKNGYLEIGHLNDKACKDLEKTIRENLSQLEILPQWVMCESSGVFQIQVFSAAPSFQGSRCPEPGSCAARIAEMIVVKQYELIAKLAVIRAKTNYNALPLHLTLVGQGAFNNPPHIIEKALNAVAKVVKGRNVDVYVHVFKSPEKIQFINNIHDPAFKVVHMSKDEFKLKKG